MESPAFRGVSVGSFTVHVMDTPEPVIEVRRSARRRRTVQARREGHRTIVMIPAAMSEEEAEHAVRDLVAKLDARVARRGGPQGDVELERRAVELADRYLGGAAYPSSVRWVSNQNKRWGSCSTQDGRIRLSDRLKPMPGYVIDYVLVHELAHLLHADHGPDFQLLLNRYEKKERAEGYLEAVEQQQR